MLRNLFLNGLLNRLSIVLLTTLVAVTVSASSAFALSLEEAKAKGLVGETLSGYVAAVNGDSNSEIAALISSVNAKRKKEYADIAFKNGTDVKSVEALAAKRAIERSRGGHYVQLSNGNWSKK